MPEYYVGWWNVENLFDHALAPDRPDYLRDALRGELRGWTAAVRDRKISQLAQIITQMNQARGPDLLGVCEIENEQVMQLLVEALAPLGRNYQVAHHDTSDGRGIDIGFIFDADRFTFERDFHYAVLKRSSTRDIYQVNLRTASGQLLVVIGNHWPARLGDPAYRIVAAETLSYWVQRIHETLGGEPPILVLGDFNDEPFDRSLTDFALSTRTTARVLYARNHRLFNLMWPLLKGGDASYVYVNTPNMLDQFLVSKGMLRRNAPIRALTDTVSVLRFRRWWAPARTAGHVGFLDPQRRPTTTLTGLATTIPSR
jgi:predicted extracellular nuclease